MLSKVILYFSIMLYFQPLNLLAEEEVKEESKPLSIEERLNRQAAKKKTPWKKFPIIEAKNIFGSSAVKIEPKKGEALVLVFGILVCTMPINDWGIKAHGAKTQQ